VSLGFADGCVRSGFRYADVVVADKQQSLLVTPA
jgi:hypothetical protein